MANSEKANETSAKATSGAGQSVTSKAAEAGTTAEAAAARAKILEGVDFIETEEDAEAVESAVVKIQSTFRGKKIRSKLGGGSAKPEEKTDTTTATATTTTTNDQEKTKEEELNKKVATMQVNDNSDSSQQKEGAGNPTKLPEEEAERAATKIQAGFKGYKTRKELEVGKMGSTANSGQAGSQSDSGPPQEEEK